MPIAGYILLALMLATALGAQAQEGGDTQARIDYAYQTEDGNSLANLIQNLAAQVQSDAGDTNARYHLAHGQYRFGQLAHEHNARVAEAAFARAAEAAFSDCIDQLKPVIEKDVKSAEGMVLQSACYSGLADSRMLEAVLFRTRAAERLKSALKLEPRNPRAVFLSAVQEMHHAKPGSAESQRAFSQLQLAAQLFEQSSGTSNDAPGWGHAEAYLALGRELQNRGDHLGARNWIEKALIAAPDYKMAQRQLASLAKP
jgi:tetratricopeptide (TPR) repeat protein